MLTKQYGRTKQFIFIILLSLPLTSVASTNEYFEDDEYVTGLKVNSQYLRQLRARCTEIEQLAKKADIHKSRVNQLNVDEDSIPDETSEISADSLETKKVKKDACIGSLSSQSICTDRLNSVFINSDLICANNLNVSGESCISDLLAFNACTTQLNANTACIDTLTVNNLLNCGLYRATAVYSNDTLYNLGDDLNFDAILDDPNSNLQTGPTRYTAPLSGYYIITLDVDHYEFMPFSESGSLLNIPVSNPELLVNGIVSRKFFTSFLQFMHKQHATFTTMLHLFAGDVVTVRFAVLSSSEAFGFGSIPGTVVISGDGTVDNQSIFQIHLLSVDCDPNNSPCLPCGPNDMTGCPQCPTLCQPATTVTCK